MLELLLVAALAYVAWNSGALAPLGFQSPSLPATPALPPSGLQPGAQFGTGQLSASSISPVGQTTQANVAALALTGGASIATAAVSAPATFAALGLTGAAAGAAVAGIGVVIAIGAALEMAHLQRAKQARDENTAVNLGIAGVDQDIRTVSNAFNSHQLSPTDAIQLIQQIRANYWRLVTPHIQPGRNGCNGGAGCPPWPTGGNGCSGNIGAACCVGCYDLEGQDGPAPGLGYIGFRGTIQVLMQGGGTVTMQAVYPSSYGTKARAQYVVNWAHQ
jgi:hypothetical protein